MGKMKRPRRRASNYGKGLQEKSTQTTEKSLLASGSQSLQPVVRLEKLDIDTLSALNRKFVTVRKEATSHDPKPRGSLMNKIRKAPDTYSKFAQPITNNERANSTSVTLRSYHHPNSAGGSSLSLGDFHKGIKPGPLQYKLKKMMESENMRVPVVMLSTSSPSHRNLETIRELNEEPMSNVTLPLADLEQPTKETGIQTEGDLLNRAVLQDPVAPESEDIQEEPRNLQELPGTVSSDGQQGSYHETPRPERITLEFRGITTVLSARTKPDEESSPDNDSSDDEDDDTPTGTHRRGSHKRTYVIINDTHLDNAIAEDQDPVTMMSILIIGIFLTLLIFLSVAGNILVCVAIYTDRGLRRIGNLFLASLAIADLFVASLVMTFAGVNDILGYWIFGAQFCDTWVAFDVMCSTASILNLCAISLDRYIHIKDPLRYGRWVTRRVALGTIATIWLLAALISFVPISLGLHRPPQPLVYNAGGQNYPTCALDLTPTYAVVSSCISFYVPCIVMLGIYCRLYCYAQKHVKNIRAITRPIDLPDNATNATTTATATSKRKSMKQKNKALHIHLHNHHSSPYHVSDHKAAITVGIIMGVFLICWVPFFCINIVAAFCKTCIPDITFKILTWLGYSNSAFNPIIYSIFNTEFREAFKRILTAHYPEWCKCGYQSVALNSHHHHHHDNMNNKFVTDYGGTKTVVVNARRNNSFGEFSSEHLSTESVHQTRVNSAEKDMFNATGLTVGVGVENVGSVI